MKSLSRVRLFATPWTVVYQAPPSMGFSRQEYWSGLPFPSPGDLPYPGIEPGSPTLQADTLTSEPPGKPNCGIARERKKKRELSCKKLQPKALPGCSQNKGLSEYQRRASQLQIGPCPARGGDSHSRKARGKLGPRDGILYQTASRFPVAKIPGILDR